MIVFARGLVVSPYARDMSSMIFTNTYLPDTTDRVVWAFGRRILTLCCMTEEHDRLYFQIQRKRLKSWLVRKQHIGTAHSVRGYRLPFHRRTRFSWY